MTPLSFVSKHYGTYIRSSGGIGGECVDLANEWIAECCGLAHVFRNAVDWARPDLPRMRWTANTPLNAPISGSLIVWGESEIAGIGPNGHIALVLAADSLHCLSFDQNFPSGSLAGIQLHSYAGVLGWQTPSI